MIYTCTVLTSSPRLVTLMITNIKGRKRDSYFMLSLTWERAEPFARRIEATTKI